MSSNPQRNSLLEFQKKLFASRFFTISVLIHFVLVLFGGTKALFDSYQEPPDFTSEAGGGFIGDAVPQAPPTQEVPQQQAPTMTVATQMPTSNLNTITTSAPTEVAFTMPSIVAPTMAPTLADTKINTPAPTGLNMNSNALSAAQVQQIGAFTGSWAKKSSRGGGIGSNPKDREFEFTAYLAKYGNPRDPSRRGDWDSTNWVKDNKIIGGSLANLLYYMNKKSRDRIKADPQAVPLDLSDEAAIMSKKPPFIFFTGHQDFVLSDQEVSNLQKYVRLGGCIWGDSSLPGLRSRFDIAFRREMRRVISDADKDWEVLPATHPLYTKNLYYPDMKTPPTGLNFYQEPVYALKFAGEVAVIYTANDYGDMWQIGLTPDDKYDMSNDGKGFYIATNVRILQNREILYRNLEIPALINSYKFGTNVVIHLLTRWEDRLRAAPSGM